VGDIARRRRDPLRRQQRLRQQQQQQRDPHRFRDLGLPQRRAQLPDKDDRKQALVLLERLLFNAQR